MRTTVFLVLLAFLLVPSVLAIGVSPPTVQVDYVPGKTYEFTINLINYNSMPITVDIEAQGDYKDNVRIKQPIRIAPGGSTPVQVTFTAPESLPRPGYHTVYVTFIEDYVDESAGQFSARTAVTARIVMWQPYPGQYAEITPSAQSVSAGNDTFLKVVINNLGVEAITDATATVRVVSATGELKDAITITSINVEGNSNSVYNRLLKTSTYAPGRYTLEAKLDYGSNQSYMNNTFVVGEEKVDALQIEGPFYLDKPVNRFTVHLESLWNLPIDNVYAVLKLGGKESQTQIVDFEPFGRAAVTGYWETDPTIQPGQVAATVVVFFGNKQQEYVLPVTVYNETPRVAPVEEEPTLVLSGADILFIIGVTVIVLCLILFAINKHLNHDEPPQNHP